MKMMLYLTSAWEVEARVLPALILEEVLLELNWMMNILKRQGKELRKWKIKNTKISNYFFSYKNSTASINKERILKKMANLLHLYLNYFYSIKALKIGNYHKK